MPKGIIHDVMPMYDNNSTMAQMHVDLAGNLLIFYVTFAYVILTLYLVSQSKEAIAQSKKEQQIRDIEKALEEFYIPALDILENRRYDTYEEPVIRERIYKEVVEGKLNNFRHNDDTVNIHIKGFRDIKKYRYLGMVKK